MGTAIATMAKRDKLDSIDIVSPFSLHAYDDEDEREDRDADAQVPIEVDHAAPPSSLLARGKTVMAPTS